MQTEVTRILEAVQQGDQQASEELLPVVYEELRRLAESRMAQESSGNTLQATALVHEAYIYDWLAQRRTLIYGGTIEAISSPLPPKRCVGF